MNYLKDMTNEQLKSCLLNDMESLRDGGWVPDDDSIDDTVSVIEEVFKRIDVYSRKTMLPRSKRKPHDRHALSNKLITNALKRGDIK